MPAAPRLSVLGRAAGSFVAGLAVAFAFPPFDQPWLMPLGLAGLMLTVRGLRFAGHEFGVRCDVDGNVEVLDPPPGVTVEIG